jgi:hypothetical protein
MSVVHLVNGIPGLGRKIFTIILVERPRWRGTTRSQEHEDDAYEGEPDQAIFIIHGEN